MDKIKVPVVPERKCQTSYASSVVNLSVQTNESRLVVDSKLFPIVVLLFGRDELRLTSRLVVFGNQEVELLVKQKCKA